MDKRRLIYAPRAQRDLLRLPKRQALQILDDLLLLETPPWPPGKVKKLRGVEYWEIKTGDYRTIFWPSGDELVILRLIHRRELEAAVERINLRALKQWLADTEPNPKKTQPT